MADLQFCCNVILLCRRMQRCLAPAVPSLPVPGDRESRAACRSAVTSGERWGQGALQCMPCAALRAPASHHAARSVMRCECRCECQPLVLCSPLHTSVSLPPCAAERRSMQPGPQNRNLRYKRRSLMKRQMHARQHLLLLLQQRPVSTLNIRSRRMQTLHSMRSSGDRRNQQPRTNHWRLSSCSSSCGHATQSRVWQSRKVWHPGDCGRTLGASSRGRILRSRHPCWHHLALREQAVLQLQGPQRLRSWHPVSRAALTRAWRMQGMQHHRRPRQREARRQHFARVQVPV